MAHLINVDIVNRLQSSFPDEFEATSRHKIRSSDDMQFAFSYYYFLMNEISTTNLTSLVKGYDTDHSRLVLGVEL